MVLKYIIIFFQEMFHMCNKNLWSYDRYGDIFLLLLLKRMVVIINVTVASNMQDIILDSESFRKLSWNNKFPENLHYLMPYLAEYNSSSL